MRSFLALLLGFLTVSGMGQESKLIGQQAIHITINTQQDTIDFMIVDTALTQKKPIFLFCQGSLPLPLFVELEQQGIYMFGGGINNFDYQALVRQYHLVVISMPHTPMIVPQAFLNPQYQYVPDPTKPRQFSQAYLEADYLDNYVRRAKIVLDYLSKQIYVESSRLVVAGHSQGAKVATKIAGSYPAVSHLGLFAPNPIGRIDQFIRQARLDAQLGKISWEEADSMMNEQISFFQTAHHSDSVKKHPYLKAWKTFSEPFYDDWLELTIPLYIAYGTEDRTADLCDLVPLFFIQEGKDNLTLKRYLGLEHNFFEKSRDGRVNYEQAHWPEVMTSFVAWIGSP
ncbi:MAG: hypothetical protein AAF587_04890 [Bacteroidota bacterium]